MWEIACRIFFFFFFPSLPLQIFDFCYAYKHYYMKQGRETPICDRIVFNKIRKLLGGRMRWGSEHHPDQTVPQIVFFFVCLSRHTAPMCVCVCTYVRKKKFKARESRNWAFFF